MRNLIFGGAGFIGSNLAARLVGDGQDVCVFDNLQMGNQLGSVSSLLTVGDMTNQTLVRETLSTYRPDRIFHLAANSDISASSKNPNLDIDNTLITTVSLAGAIRDIGTPVDIVFASSSAIYGEHQTKMNEQTPAKPISSYGWMKLASERILQQLAIDGLIGRCLSARFPNVTGVSQTHGVVHDLVKKLKDDNSRLVVLGDGSQAKPYALASELVDNILRVHESQEQGFKAYNFSPHNTVTVREIVTEIIAASGLNPEVVYGSEPIGWAGDINRYELDCSAVELDHGPLLFSNSEEAIKVSARWAWDYLEA
jgi:UDP-glucose 4-epimerase